MKNQTPDSKKQPSYLSVFEATKHLNVVIVGSGAGWTSGRFLLNFDEAIVLVPDILESKQGWVFNLKQKFFQGSIIFDKNLIGRHPHLVPRSRYFSTRNVPECCLHQKDVLVLVNSPESQVYDVHNSSKPSIEVLETIFRLQLAERKEVNLTQIVKPTALILKHNQVSVLWCDEKNNPVAWVLEAQSRVKNLKPIQFKTLTRKPWYKTIAREPYAEQIIASSLAGEVRWL